MPFKFNPLTGELDLVNPTSGGGGGLSDPGSNGILARTALNTTVARTLTGTANQITITNGDGVSGNPTFSLPSAITTPGSLTITGHLLPASDSLYTLGGSSNYWSNTYTDRLYLNSTAYLDGGTAGNVTINGNGGATGVITATDSTNSTATQMMTLLTSSLNNAITYINFGKALSTNNYGRIFFTHSSDGSANNSIALSVGGGSAQIKIFNNSIQHTGSLYPSADSANELGLSTRYYSNTYTDRLYLNATAYIDGATAGQLKVTGLFMPVQATTAGAPAYVKGAMYFDTTLNKLRIGGATAWETVTSV